MADIHLAVLPGDGVGPEVTRAGLRVLDAVADVADHRVRSQSWPVGWAALAETGTPLPDETLAACLAADAILLGAVGDPHADDLPPSERPVSGLLRLRRELGCFANLRPLRVSGGLIPYSPLRPERVRGTDLVIVRELSGGLYYGEPRGLDESAGQAWNSVSCGCEEIRRIAEVAFELAADRRGRVTSVDKANVLEVSRLWRTVVDEVGLEHPGVSLEHMLVDRAAMELALRPTQFDVILTENLFGDILSDEAGALAGSLGLQGSASLGGRTDLYEPVHGSAPDIAGAGAANPTGAIASIALMLRHTFGLDAEADMIDRALDRAFAEGCRTRDLEPSDAPGESPLGTAPFAEAVIERLEGER